MGSRIDNRLVVDALEMALARRLPGEGLVAHSDRGSQYPAREKCSNGTVNRKKLETERIALKCFSSSRSLMNGLSIGEIRDERMASVHPALIPVAWPEQTNLSGTGRRNEVSGSSPKQEAIGGVLVRKLRLLSSRCFAIAQPTHHGTGDGRPAT
jgi:hypothetical protein